MRATVDKISNAVFIVLARSYLSAASVIFMSMSFSPVSLWSLQLASVIFSDRARPPMLLPTYSSFKFTAVFVVPYVQYASYSIMHTYIGFPTAFSLLMHLS
jgi:hypothetical protein